MSDQEIVLTFRLSPEGEKAIGMVIHGRIWLWFTSKEALLASRLQKQLLQDFHIESILGLPVSKRSVETFEQILFVEKQGVVGIYVPEESFKDLFSLM